MSPVSISLRFGIMLAALMSAPKIAAAGYDMNTVAGRLAAAKAAALKQEVDDGAFPVIQAELAGLKLSVNPNDTATKNAFFRVLANRPLKHRFAFWSYSTMHGYMVGKKAFNQKDQDFIRNYLQQVDYITHEYPRNYNGEVLHSVTVTFICQEWGDKFRDAGGNTCGGPNGLASKARATLMQRMQSSFAAGDPERGSFVYDTLFTVPLKLLATYVKDPELERAARAAFYSRIVDLAVSWNNGLLTATGQREKGFSTYGPGSPRGSYQIALWLFGAPGQAQLKEDIDPRYLFDSYLDKKMPDVLIKLGQQNRSGKTYTSKIGSMYRTMHHSSNYSLASAAYSGWKWNRSIDFSATDNIMHWRVPGEAALSRVASFRVGHENTTHGIPIPPADGRKAEMSRYGEGRSPYSRVFQHEGTLVGLLNSPKRDRFLPSDPAAPVLFKAQYAMFPNDGSLIGPLRIVNNKWIVANAGSTFFAVYFPKKYWIANADYKPDPKGETSYTIYRSDKRRNGWVLETAEAARYEKYGKTNAAQFEAFVKDIANNAKVDISRLDTNKPALTYKSIHGYTLKFEYDPVPENGTSKVRFINGKPIDYAGFKVYDILKNSGSYIDVHQALPKKGGSGPYKIVLTPKGSVATKTKKAVIRWPN